MSSQYLCAMVVLYTNRPEDSKTETVYEAFRNRLGQAEGPEQPTRDLRV